MQGQEVFLKSPQGEDLQLFFTEPSWIYSVVSTKDNLSFVEVDLTDRIALDFVPADNAAEYEKTGEFKYIHSVTRLVIQTDIETGERIGFLMTIIPSVEYSAHLGNQISKNTYLKRENNLDGLIVYHNLSGEFVNGWEYEEGRIVSSLIERPGEGSIIYRTIPATYEVKQKIATRSGDAEYGEELPTVEITGKSPGGSVGYDGSNGWDRSWDPEPVGSGNSNNGSDNGGYLFNPQQITPSARTDCPSSATTNSTKINSVLNNESSSLEKVKPDINLLRQYAKTKSVEYGLTVNFSSGQYYVLNYSKLGNPPAYIASGTQNNVTITTTNSSYLMAHTHPIGTNPAPSPLDAIALASNYAFSPDITANIVFAADGSEYMVYVDNRTALASFCKNSNNSVFFAPNGSLFKSGSDWATTYNTVYNDLIKNGYSQNDAQSYALSYVLDYYNTGLKIYEKKIGKTDFKEQKTEKSGNNYLPKICN
jgi:hypothetical protein